MKNLNFIEVANHNIPRLNKGVRNLAIIVGICAVGIIISLIFYDQYTEDAILVTHGVESETKIGWPATLYGYSVFFFLTFIIFIIYIKFKQDLKKPAFGITNQGVFINQQILRNAFVPWNNIESVESRGLVESPTVRIKFKDIDALLKGQFFILKSIAKANLKTNNSIGISKDECVGDLKKMYELIKERV
jgi:hypothetical protein